MRNCRLTKICSALLLLAVFIPALPLAANAASWKTEWVPTRYVEKELNAKALLVMRTEYPVYRPGVTQLYLTIENKTRSELLHGAEYILEQKRNDGWYTQQIIGSNPDEPAIWWPDIGYIVPKRETTGTDIRLHFPLEPGEYRIIKRIGTYKTPPKDYPFSATFTVAEGGYDPARLSGYVLLSSLTETYTHEQAISDGVFYLDQDGKVHNKDRLLTFLKRVRQSIPAKLRVLEDGVEGQFIITDITYDSGLFLWEQCTLRNPMQLDIYVDGKPLHTKYKKSEVFRRYYPYLISYKKDGKMRLVLSDWTSTPIPEANEWWIVEDTACVGRRAVAALLKSPYGDLTDPAYRVYKEDGKEWVSYELKDGKHMLTYFDTPNSIRDIQITEERGVLKELLMMEWSAEQTVRLTFAAKGGGTCAVTFNVASEKIMDVRYS